MKRKRIIFVAAAAIAAMAVFLTGCSIREAEPVLEGIVITESGLNEEGQLPKDGGIDQEKIEQDVKKEVDISQDIQKDIILNEEVTAADSDYEDVEIREPKEQEKVDEAADAKPTIVAKAILRTPEEAEEVQTEEPQAPSPQPTTKPEKKPNSAPEKTQEPKPIQETTLRTPEEAEEEVQTEEPQAPSPQPTTKPEKKPSSAPEKTQEPEPTQESTPDPTPAPSVTDMGSAYKEQVFAAVNSHRQTKLSATDADLNKTAQAHAMAMAQSNGSYHSCKGVESVAGGAFEDGYKQGVALTVHCSDLAEDKVIRIGVGAAKDENGAIYVCVLGKTY